MSDGPAISRQIALPVAKFLVEQLRPVCERIEIAGSLRREKATVHDIEIVCIPRTEPDLFDVPMYTDAGVLAALKELPLKVDWTKLICNGPFLKKFMYNDIKVELYLTTPEKWGVIFTLRTGSEEFSKCLVTIRQHGGMLPSNMVVKDGRVWRHGGNFQRFDNWKQEQDHPLEALDTPEEEDLFRVLGLNWIEPKERK